MTNDPIHRPTAHRPLPIDVDVGHELAPVQHGQGLTPAQYAELQAIVAHTLATTTVVKSDEQRAATLDWRADRSPLAEPGVLIVIVMLALVALVAIVALAAVFGLSLISA